MTRTGIITDQQWRDAENIWNYHLMGHELRPCDVAVGLGGPDLGVATFSAELYQANLFPVLVFSGDNSPATEELFPRGEAVQYREHAMSLGVPDSAILVELNARNTGQNISFSRALLAENGWQPSSVLLISMPYMERRAYATCSKAWPGVSITCASAKVSFADYVRSMDDEKLVIDMMVGDLQRVIEYPKQDFAIEQHVPTDTMDAYARLVEAGFDSCLLK